jgi:hypothetical protein
VQYWEDNHKTPLSARNRILASICPQLYGLYVVKLAIALILAGGVTVSEQEFSGFKDSEFRLQMNNVVFEFVVNLICY